MFPRLEQHVFTIDRPPAATNTEKTKTNFPSHFLYDEFFPNGRRRFQHSFIRARVYRNVVVNSRERKDSDARIYVLIYRSGVLDR